jgi:hypothetical protein
VGCVERFGKLTDGRYYLAFAVFGGPPADPNRYYPPNVICYIVPGNEKEFARFKKDSTAIVCGTVIGRQPARAEGGYIIELKDCRVVK